MTQQSHEDTEAYLKALFNASEHCDFVNRNESIRDQFVSGILNEDLAEKIELLYYSKEGNLTLDHVVEYSRTYNDVHDGRKLEREQTKSVDEVRKYTQNKSIPKPKEENKQPKRNCNFCGRSHLPRRCPAYGKTCNKCKKSNHFANVCKQDKSKIDAVSDEVSTVKCDDSSVAAQAFLGEVKSGGESTRPSDTMRIDMKVGTSVVNFKVDTGADVSVMNFSTFQMVKSANAKFQLKKAFYL